MNENGSKTIQPQVGTGRKIITVLAGFYRSVIHLDRPLSIGVSPTFKRTKRQVSWRSVQEVVSDSQSGESILSGLPLMAVPNASANASMISSLGIQARHRTPRFAWNAETRWSSCDDVESGKWDLVRWHGSGWLGEVNVKMFMINSLPTDFCSSNAFGAKRGESLENSNIRLRSL